jgi:hypothetical protein
MGMRLYYTVLNTELSIYVCRKTDYIESKIKAPEDTFCGRVTLTLLAGRLSSISKSYFRSSNSQRV